MKKLTIFVFILTAVSVNAQRHFKLTDASKTVDVGIRVPECKDSDPCGPAKFSFYRKASAKPFQTVTLKATSMWDDEPKANVTKRYDDQSTINFGDYNFDGQEDVAISDGNDGGYGMPSYRVYLYSAAKRMFVYSPAFSAIGHEGSLGMFEVDKKKKLLSRNTKSGCCWHQTESFDVFHGKPRKVFEYTEDATVGDGKYVQVTTRRLVGSKWHTTTRREKAQN